MPHILVLGATGYLGSELCTHLLNAGHTVYGLARSPAKASGLAQVEVIPILGSVDSPQGIKDALTSQPEISIVIDAAAVYGESVTLLNMVKSAAEQRMKRFASAGVSDEFAPKLGYIYVSGMWVHGSDKDNYASDGNPLTGDTDADMPKPVGMVSWRPQIERLILSADTRTVLDTAIVRPACMYGNASGIWTGPMMAVLNAAKSGEPDAKVGLAHGATASLIHVADAASAIRCVAEKLPLISKTGVYPVFDLMAQVESLLAIFEGAGRVFGFKGSVQLVGPPEGDVLSDALGASVIGDSSRVRTILGWAGPNRKSFLQGIGVYAKAWQAAFESHKK